MWTEERDETLKTMLAGGATVAEAAKKLGVTRNAAMGRASRRGFKMNAPNHGGWDEKRRDAARAARAERSLKNKSRATFKPKAPLKPQPPPPQRDPLPSLHLPLIELQNGDCRWPAGEGPFTFCGQPALQGRPYCMAHSRIAYQPIIERRRERVPAE